MTAATRWPAPAKLNLFLHVLGRRADGYHELQTVFQLVDLCDTVELAVRDDGAIVRTRPLDGVDERDDLCLRAARALKAASGTRLGVALAVEKSIPAGGGLGGGSSDAATVLVGLDALWGTDLGVDRLCELGLGLGADIPVFVQGRSAWAEGVGDVITPIALPQRAFLIVDAGVHVATADIFQAPELTRDSPPLTIPRFFAGATTRNDLEPVVRGRHPAVAAALDWLGTHAEARLTGSGGCAFAVFDSIEAAERVAARCPSRWRAHVARGLDESPLRAAASRVRERRG